MDKEQATSLAQWGIGPADEIEPWMRFACEVAREVASPDAEDLADMVRESDLPALAECLRGTLAQDAATIAALRSECETMQAELATLRALVGEVPRALVAGLPEVVSRLAEVEHLRAQVAQLQADRALLVGVAFRAYGTSIAPPGRATQERIGVALQAQFADYPPGVSQTDAIRAILCRMAAEVAP